MFLHVSVHHSVCPHLGGVTPVRSKWVGGRPVYPSQVQLGYPTSGTPIRPGRGYPPARWGYPCWGGPHLGYPLHWTWLGVPLLGVLHLGYPHQTWLGVPHLRYLPCQTWSGHTPARGTHLGTPHWTWLGGTLPRVCPCQTWLEVPLPGRYPTSGIPHQTWLEVHHLGYPHQTWLGGPTLGNPLSDLAGGYSCQERYPCWETPPQVPPIGPGWGVLHLRYPPPCQTWPGGTPARGEGTPPLVEYLIRRGRYASCVHAGGLSCCLCIYINPMTATKQPIIIVPGENWYSPDYGLGEYHIPDQSVAVADEFFVFTSVAHCN